MKASSSRWPCIPQAEDAARELPNLPLEDALKLVHLYFERGSPKAEPAARRWLVRYLGEGTPGLRDIARVTASLAELELEARELNRCYFFCAGDQAAEPSCHGLRVRFRCPLPSAFMT